MMSRHTYTVVSTETPTHTPTAGELEELLDKALRDLGVDPGVIVEATKAATKVVTRPRKVGPRLRNRTLRKAGVYPCNRRADPLHAAAILWPTGVPHTGCGRTFTTEKRRTLHEAGDGWDPVTFPSGCLDRILPLDQRDTR
jgi:hypothetical protein